MSPLQIWCNEAQERYVLAIAPDAARAVPRDLRARALPVRGGRRGDRRRPAGRCDDPLFGNRRSTWSSRAARQAAADDARRARACSAQLPPLDAARHRACARPRCRVLRCRPWRTRPSSSRSATAPSAGCARATRWSGPWQVPVADCAVTLLGFDDLRAARRWRWASARRSRCSTRRPRGAWRSARRSPTSPRRRSTRLARREALGQLDGGGRPPGRGRGALRHGAARWRWSCARAGHQHPGRQGLAVDAHDVAGGRRAEGGDRAAVAHRLGVRAGDRRARHAHAAAADRRGRDRAAAGRSRRAASTGSAARPWRRCTAQLGDEAPDLDDAATLQALLRGARRAATATGCCSPTTTAPTAASSSRSCEMAFAGRAGVRIDLARLAGLSGGARILAALFNEELGAVLQVRRARARRACCAVLQRPRARRAARHRRAEPRTASCASRLRRRASSLAEPRVRAAARLVARPATRCRRCATTRTARRRSTTAILDAARPGPRAPRSRFDPAEDVAAPFVARGARPRVAILREQGVNGQVEMAAAFDRAGFEAVDVHMSDIIAGRVSLDGLQGLRGLRRLLLRRRAGRGRGLGEVDPVQRARARRVRGVLRARGHLRARRLQRLPDDGGAARAHPRRRATGRASCATAPSSSRRASCMVEVAESPSIFFAGMAGSRIPIAVAHGEGHAEFTGDGARCGAGARRAALRGQPRRADRDATRPTRTARPHGITGAHHGRRPLHHPDAAPGARVPDVADTPGIPTDWGEDGPWMRMFRNARAWVGLTRHPQLIHVTHCEYK